jgi:protein-disulfide isomerase
VAANPSRRALQLPTPALARPTISPAESEIIEPVRLTCQAVCALLLATAISTLGCHAQVPAPGALSPDLARRVELLIRSRTKIPPDYILTIGPRTPSEVPGFDKIEITVFQDGQPSHPIAFLLSTDGKTLAQFNKFDISKDPRTIVSGAGRPARGGAESAPVEIVVFDDLECPYCARMHAQLFPALLDRYGNNVRIVYKDYPLSQHPWAMRAAVDANCVGDQSTPAYWNLVDYIHAHASDFGGTEHSVDKANQSLDQLALDEAKKNSLKTPELEACIKKQDNASIKASMKIGDDLGVEATPVLFINGEKLEGAYPLEDVFRMVDGALTALGKTPPPAYKAPAPPNVGPTPASPKTGN